VTDHIAERIPPKEKSRGWKTILIVEDEELMLCLLERFFSRHGYQVMVASDGEQAVGIYHAHQREIDAVLLDVRLPRMTGEEVFRRMKEKNAAVRVVMASGFLEPGLKAEMALAGVRYFMDKPYVLEELLEIFQSLIDGER
jgi:DNA-binding response OmpR family regulator